MRARLMMLASLGLAAAGCGGTHHAVAACSNTDNALNGTAFVFVSAPVIGARVSSGFTVTGCSKSFESTVDWELTDRDGRTLAKGVTQGGGLRPGPFHFTVRYTLVTAELGELDVATPRVTDEGFPPLTNVVPLVLAAS